MNTCDYGCGNEATYQFKNGKWCCSQSFRSCVGFRKNTSGINSWNYGLKRSKKSKKKMSLAKKGKPLGKHMLNNFKDKKHSNKSKKLMSEKLKGVNKGRIPWNKNRRMSIDEFKEKYPLFSRIEEMRTDPLNKLNTQFRCKNHNCSNSKEQHGWFTPSYIAIYERIRQIELGNGGSYLYCSDDCKNECPLYYLKSDPNKEILQLYTVEEYQTWRQQVLKREDYKCEYCDEPAADVHHSRSQKLEPGFVLDPDFGIACCESCHYKYGHKTGTECSTGNLANTICN